MDDDLKKYIRAGVDYYRAVEIPLANDSIKTLKKWNKQTIIDDFGLKAIKDIEKYEGFCSIPSHTDFKKVIKNFYNRYEQLSYRPSNNGNWNTIDLFLKHIFDEQYDLGLDYLTILWRNPLQILPILCLVSKERNTGKTTFIILMKHIFESNMTINTNEDFRSRFNSEWAGKLIIAVDEVLLDKVEDSERIKNLSTARYFKKEAKGVDKEEVEFFGKFILCSNNEENFVKIDAVETRYWVRQIPVLRNCITKLLEEMKREIPAFVHFLGEREMFTKEGTRMWFTPQQLHTKALDKLMKGNSSTIEKEIEELLFDEFSSTNQEFLCYTSQNLVEMLRRRNFTVTSSYVTSTLRNKFGLVPKNSSYKYFRSDLMVENCPEGLQSTNEKGRFYTFNRIEYIKDVEVLNDVATT